MAGFFKSGGSDAVGAYEADALTSKNAAEAAQTAAELAETNAELAETNAETAQTAAEAAQTASELAETNAETAETNAETAQAAAAGSATAASNSSNTATTKAGESAASASTASTASTSATNSSNTATTKASEASTSASNAASSSTAAANSATTSATQAQNSSTSAASSLSSKNASVAAKTAAETAETNAETAETNAAGSATAAAGSATAATNSSSTASSQASASATQASSSATSATSSSNSAASAATAQTAAEAARDSALAALDSFDDRYLGSKSSAPSVDNDGNALVAGALYFDSAGNAMKVFDGSNWLNAYASLSGALIANQNLSDLNNAATARSNLGFNQGVATGDSPTFAALTSTGEITANGGIALGDNDKATFGAGNDLQIYHDGTDSLIDNSTGSLTIDAGVHLFLKTASGESLATFLANGANQLFYDNAVKLATAAGGVAVTGTLTPSGVLTANAGVVVDNFTLEGNTLALSSGDMTLDAAGDITLDAAGNQINFKSGGTSRGYVDMSTGGLILRSLTSDADIILQGTDGSSSVNALRLDMSAAGAATFSAGVTFNGTATMDGLVVGASSAGRATLGTFINTTNAGGTEASISLQNNQVGCSVNLVADRTGANFGSDFYIENADNTGALKKRLNVSEIGDVSFYNTAGTSQSLFWDASAKSLGIGTSSPSTALHVDQNSDNNGITLANTVRGTAKVSMQLSGANNEDYSFSHHNGTDTDTLSIHGRTGHTFKINNANAMTLDAGAATFASSVSSGGIVSASTTFRATSGSMQFFVPNVGEAFRLEQNTATFNFKAGGVINESGADSDFRVESNNNANMLFVDGGTNRVGIGTNSPSANLHVSSSGDTIARITSADGSTAVLDLGDASDPDGGRVFYDSGSNLGFTTQSQERMRIDSSGNVLVGKTTTDANTVGHNLLSNGSAYHIRDGGTTAIFNRKTSDGQIIAIQKDHTTVGSIGTIDGDLNIHASASGHKGLRFGNGFIAPTGNSTTIEDATTNLGLSTHRFKDLYLSGTANVGSLLSSASGAGANAFSAGLNAGASNQGGNSVAIGNAAGSTNQGVSAVSLGLLAGNSLQGNYGVAIGISAAQTSQGILAVAAGYYAGYTNQGASSVAIGQQAGQTSQGASAVALGQQAGETDQGVNAVAVGYAAGKNTQGFSATAVGYFAGETTQGDYSVAFGINAGKTSQGSSATSLGNAAGKTTQGASAVAVGVQAGQTSQGASSVAVGASAGVVNQGANGILINSSGSALNDTSTGHIRLKSTTGELAFTTAAGWSVAGGNISLPTTKKLVLDSNAGSDSYLWASANDTVELWAGAKAITAIGANVTLHGTLSSNLVTVHGAASGNEGGEISLAGAGSNEGINIDNYAGTFRVYDVTSPAVRLTLDTAGNLAVAGSLSKGSGSFRIDHPLKPDTHQLVHSFTESPQADLLYSGVSDLVDGAVEVNIDEFHGMSEGTFAALNRNIRVFTTNETDWEPIKGSVTGNILSISCQDASCSDRVSWLVIGERQDQHMMDTDWTDEQGRVIVEPLKPEVPAPVQRTISVPVMLDGEQVTALETVDVPEIIEVIDGVAVLTPATTEEVLKPQFEEIGVVDLEGNPVYR